MTKTILRIDSSIRKNDSVSRKATDAVIADLLKQNPEAQVVVRDLGDGLPLIDEAWTAANFTPEEDRTNAHNGVLASSDSLIEELKSADFIVLGLPVYNFGVPASLKTWVDHIARARKTFRYTENGPIGLLEDRPVTMVYASGGTPVGASFEFSTPYMKQAFGFVGITNVEVVEAKKILEAQTAGV